MLGNLPRVWHRQPLVAVFVVLAMVSAAAFLSACQHGTTDTSPTATPPSATAPLDVKRAEVVYQAGDSGAEEALGEGARRAVRKDDRLRLKEQAEAWLTLRAYVIRLYRDTEVKARAQEGITAINSLHLAFGALFAEQNAEARAQEHVQIVTDAAVITSLDTEFFVYHDSTSRTTWVVVLRDKVEVQGAGRATSVSAGWQTWVEAGQPPAPPVLALRNEIGQRFPRVDDLTNGALADGRVLPNLTRCIVSRDAVVSVEVRAQPTGNAVVIALVPRDRLFGAVARTEAADWVYGYGGDQRTIGWVRVEAVQCEAPIASLPVQPGLPLQATATPTPAGPPSVTPLPPLTPTATRCQDAARYVADVTIPDGTELKAGTGFTKTWRIRNTGTCPWEPDYQLVFVNGAALGGRSAPLGQTVLPGQTVDVSVQLVAPMAPGTYKGEWQMRNSVGAPFGQTITVVIVVPGPITPTPTPRPTRTATLPPTRTPTRTPTPTPTMPLLQIVSVEAAPNPVTYGGDCGIQTLTVNVIVNLDRSRVREVRLSYRYRSDNDTSPWRSMPMNKPTPAPAPSAFFIGSDYTAQISVGREWPFRVGGKAAVEYQVLAVETDASLDQTTVQSVAAVYCLR